MHLGVLVQPCPHVWGHPYGTQALDLGSSELQPQIGIVDSWANYSSDA